MKSRRSAFAAFAVVAIALWGLAFIAASSFRDLDRQRTFALFDDAMISMRYAWNLAHGEGLVWNEGERVEGFTSLLMTLLMTGPVALFDRRTAVAAVQLLGLATLLVVAVLAARVTRTLRAGEGGVTEAMAERAAFLGTGFYYPLAYWTLMGMETGLLVALLLAAIGIAARDGFGANDRELVSAGSLLGLAQVARPDAAVPVAIVLAGCALRWSAADGVRAAVRRSALLGLVALALPAAQLLFRVAYYGDLVPNTYRLKIAGVPLGWRVELGAQHVASYLRETWPLVVAATVAVLRRPTFARAMLLSCAASLVAYQLWSGGDAWPYFRLLAPATVLLWILTVDLAAGWTIGRSPASPWRRRAAVAACATALILVNARFLDQVTFRAAPHQVDFNHHNALSAQVLDEILEEEATVGVLWAGTIPYYTGRQAIDFLGKSDPLIARLAPKLEGPPGALPGHNKYDLADSIRRRQPTYVQQFEWGTDDLRAWAETRYCPVWHRGWKTYLLRGSPLVKWDAIREDARRVERSEPLVSCASPGPAASPRVAAGSAKLARM